MLSNASCEASQTVLTTTSTTMTSRTHVKTDIKRWRQYILWTILVALHAALSRALARKFLRK